MALAIAGPQLLIAGPITTRVLFVGNSITLNYNLPGTVQGLMTNAGDLLVCDMHAIASTTLTDHSTNQDLLKAIDSGRYGYVVLQELSWGPTVPTNRDEQMFPAARLLNKHIVDSGGKTVFFQTWAYAWGDWPHCQSYDTPEPFNQCGFEGMTAALRMGYTRIAAELQAEISPVGQAWRLALAERPDIELYAPRDYHPSPSGTYLAACVFYATLTGRSPVGNPYHGRIADSDTALYLQTVAERTVFQDPWGLDPYGFGSNQFFWALPWESYTNFVAVGDAIEISGGADRPSPSVLLNSDAGQADTIYLGTVGTNASPGQGRLYIRDGANIEAGHLVVGKEGKGWVRQDGGHVIIDQLLSLGERRYSSGSYILAGGSLRSPAITRGLGTATFSMKGGTLAFGSFGQSNNPLDLVQMSGSLVVTNETVIFGDYRMNDRATLTAVLGGASSFLTVAGDAVIGGTLNINLAPGFVPAVGQRVEILNAKTLHGNWKAIRAPWLLPGGLRVVVLNQGTSVVAMIVDGQADSDGNGLPDWWELQYLGCAKSGRAWTNSLLNDGIPDGVKFALDVDPTVPMHIESFVQPGASNNFPTLTYRQLSGGSGTVGVDYTALNLTYTVETTDNLLARRWVSGTNAVEWTGDRFDNGDGTETVTVRANKPIDASRVVLLRLVIKWAAAPTAIPTPP